MIELDLDRLTTDRDYWDSVAPEGAVLYVDWKKYTPSGWYRDAGDRFIRTDRSGNYILKTDMDYEGMTAYSRPEPTPEWNGQGLPPVGTVCGISTPEMFYANCVITHQGEDFTCFRSNGRESVEYRRNIEFFPIRSEEDTAVEEMVKIIKDVIVDAPFDEYIEPYIAKAIYRAGYKKPTQ